ncbi:loganic acid O-methyltransferase-like [Quercus robur]|uniref:loganic acid O-methyltransferase-like n=1 Tax=Quercus robur TaxID=38942 RepID=UPI002163A38A|nr:loganic acid O-methyltransferase-like [Quercus robur]
MAFTTNGGNGEYSYSNNSSFQRGAADAAKELINEAIAEKLDIQNFSSSNTFRVTDLGCSVGPNTILAMQNIVDAVELKYQSQGHNTPEFQVFFNDHASNDFNTLFTSLPPDRKYYAAAVPGSFYSRLFPNASLHFVFSSYALQCLSQVPKEVLDKSSPAWNKGRIHYSNASDKVVQSYAAQYAKDMECFLNARAQEVVYGGFIVIIIPGRPNGLPHSQAIANMVGEILGSCLLDMAKKGTISEEKVDTFNLPTYFASPQEVEAIVERNGCFRLERMEILPQAIPSGNFSRGKVTSSQIRAGMEGMFKEHFGEEIIDELFDALHKKLDESSIFESGNGSTLFVLLNRIATV